MKTVEQWFEEYGASHKNPTNKKVHWICVPLITFSVVGMLWALSPLLTMGLMVAAILFYLRLSLPLAIGMALILTLMLWLASTLVKPFLVSIVIFVAAWIGQFWGHKVEGKKPSFFKDLQFLLIGPIWLLGFVFRKQGWRY